MIKDISEKLHNIMTIIKKTDFTLLTDKKDWREYYPTINPIMICGQLGIDLKKMREIIDISGTEEDKTNLKVIRDMSNQAFLYSDLSDGTTKSKIFDDSGLISGKGEVKGNVLIVKYSKEDVIKKMKAEDKKRGEDWNKVLNNGK